MVEELVLCVTTNLDELCFVVNLVRSYTEFEVARSILINVLFNDSGFSSDGILSKFTWVVSLVIDVHQDL